MNNVAEIETMNTMTIDISEAQTHLLKFLTLALQGNEVIIAQDKVPMVRLVPVPPKTTPNCRFAPRGDANAGRL